MDGIVISTERIVTAGGGVSDVGGMLSREIAAMADLLSQIRSAWQSDSAAPRFAATMSSHLEQATRLKDALLSHGATLSATGRRFAESEESLAASIGGHR